MISGLRIILTDTNSLVYRIYDDGRERLTNFHSNDVESFVTMISKYKWLSDVTVLVPDNNLLKLIPENIALPFVKNKVREVFPNIHFIKMDVGELYEVVKIYTAEEYE